MKGEQGGCFLFQDFTLRYTGGFDLGQFRKACPIAAQMHAVAIHPTMVGAFSPTGLSVQIAQFLGYSTGVSIRLMPDRSMRLEQAAVFDLNPTVKLWAQGTRPLPEKGDKALQGRV